MKTAQELAGEFPEQNPGNFEHDAALRLNDWGIEAHAMLIQQAEQIDQLEVERLRLVGEVSNRNIRALEGDKSTAAFNTLCDEYEALRLESLQLKAALRWQPASGMLESIEALSNENLALKADAERYRHLRATTNWVSNSKGQRIDVRKSPELLDAAIDAMKGKS